VSNTNDNGSNTPPVANSVIIALIGMTTVIVLAIVMLVVLRRDISAVVPAIGVIIPLLLGSVLNANQIKKIMHKTDAQSNTLTDISAATNGALTAQFTDVHRHITVAVNEALRTALAGQTMPITIEAPATVTLPTGVPPVDPPAPPVAPPTV
jgi:hypothetical protein